MIYFNRFHYYKGGCGFNPNITFIRSVIKETPPLDQIAPALYKNGQYTKETPAR
jgi:hypothetical protein